MLKLYIVFILHGDRERRLIGKPLAMRKRPKEQWSFATTRVPLYFLDSLPTWWLCRTGKCWNTIWFNGRCKFQLSSSRVSITKNKIRNWHSGTWVPTVPNIKKYGSPFVSNFSPWEVLLEASRIAMVKAAQTCLGAELLLVDHHRIAGNSLAGIHLAGKICWVFSWS